MQSLKSLCCCLCLLALTAAAGCAAWLLLSARKVMEQVPGMITLQAQETRGAILDAIDRMGMRAEFQIASTRADTVREIHETRRELSAHIVGLASVADRRLASMQSDANLHGIAWHDMTERQLSRAIDGWVRVAQPGSAFLAQAAEAAPLFLDCEFNQDCMFNRFQGTSKAVERMAQAAALEMPKFAGEFHEFNQHADRLVIHLGGIAADGRIIADRIVAPRTFWQQVTGVAKFGAGVASRFVAP